LPRNPELTGLRALAALLVFLSHYGMWTTGTDFGFRQGMVGVAIFFTLSGYLITRTYLPRFLRAFPYLPYWRSRFARIYPAYLSLLLLVYLLQGNLPSIPLRQALLNITLLQGYFFPEIWTGLNPIAWSLTVEETFYLLAPPLFLAIRRAAAFSDAQQGGGEVPCPRSRRGCDSRRARRGKVDRLDSEPGIVPLWCRDDPAFIDLWSLSRVRVGHRACSPPAPCLK
jgi:peptidoglycan/LPS O-acetylase OafA/YrhL